MLASGSVLLLLDQWSKRLVEVRLANRDLSWGRLLRIRCVRNFRNPYTSMKARTVLVIIWVVALASALILYREGIRFQNHTALIGLGCAFGGAAGNLLGMLQAAR